VLVDGAPWLFLQELKAGSTSRDMYLAAADPGRNGGWQVSAPTLQEAISAAFYTALGSGTIAALASTTKSAFTSRAIAPFWTWVLQKACGVGLGVLVASLCELCQRIPDVETLVLAALYDYVVVVAAGAPAPLAHLPPSPPSHVVYPPWFYKVDVDTCEDRGVLCQYAASVASTMATLELYQHPTVVGEVVRRKCMLTEALQTRASTAMTYATVYHVGTIVSL
jgi:hypothetical protein